jgi:hypothetical protein
MSELELKMSKVMLKAGPGSIAEWLYSRGDQKLP